MIIDPVIIDRSPRSLASRVDRLSSRLSPSPVRLAALLAILAGLALVAQGAWIPAKARLAQHLIERSWMQRQDRPWPWADTVPIARLHFERQDSSRIVLAGDSGAVLAFGPGHSSRSALPGAGGNAVISGHRDTHFALLRDLRLGDTVTVESSEDVASSQGVARSTRRTTSYTVIDHRVIRADDPTAVATVIEDAGDDRLTLVTCWPFDAIDPGTPWRYVVTAVQREEADSPARARI